MYVWGMLQVCSYVYPTWSASPYVLPSSISSASSRQISDLAAACAVTPLCITNAGEEKRNYGIPQYWQ
ncbi:hypothetical protein QL285_004905 [Trifolium repens]|nr:hypothetical protein QL285_004905 [Trifolium repens]